MTDPRAEYDRRLARWREQIARLDRVNLRISNARLIAAVAGAVLLWMAFVRATISPAWPVGVWLVFGVLAVVHARRLQREDRARTAERVYRRGFDRLDGRWAGSETDSGRVTYITATFAGPGGTFTYERALSVSQPLLGVVQQKTVVRFSVQTGAGPRYYQGKWDGQKVSGTVSVDPGGRTTIATFELSPG